jgi:hypothetical protein
LLIPISEKWKTLKKYVVSRIIPYYQARVRPGYQTRRTKIKVVEAWADFLSAHLGRIKPNTSWAVHLRSTVEHESCGNKIVAQPLPPKP